MKTRSIFLSIGIFFVISSSAQTSSVVKKLHAYKQESIPGILTAFTDDNGNKIMEDRKPTFNYWFYLEFREFEKISITDIWISGKR